MLPRTHRNQAHERFVETARIALFASAFYFLVLVLCPLLPYGRSLTSCSIGEALSNNSLDCQFCALRVIYAEPDSIAIAEIEFGKVAVQMLLAAMLVDAFHAALEDRIVAFNGVCVDDPTHVFADAVIDGLVHPILFPERAVTLPIITDDESFLGNVGADDRQQLTAGSSFLAYPVDCQSCRRMNPFTAVKRFVSWRRGMCRESQGGVECRHRVEAPIEPEHKFIEISL
jgi:hypothetical protein